MRRPWRAGKGDPLVRCPGLTVPRPVEHSAAGLAAFQTILCAIDFGPSAIRAFEYALSLAKDANAHLILLHVLESFADISYVGDTAHFSVADYQRYL